MVSLLHIFFSSYLLATAQIDNISQKEVQELSPNTFILKSKKISGEVWPEISVKAYLKAKPLEAIAIFAAYDLQKTYVPKRLKNTMKGMSTGF